MFRIASNEPQWLTLIPAAGKQPAVEVLFAPITRSMRRRAARAGRGGLEGIDPSAPIGELSDEQFDALAGAGDATSAELVRLGARDWRGIAGPDGKKLTFTPANLDLAIADETFLAAAEKAYVEPDALRVAEKNGWPGSRNGTGAKATPGNATASSPAARKGATAAKPAPIGSKPSRPRRGKASGRS